MSNIFRNRASGRTTRITKRLRAYLELNVDREGPLSAVRGGQGHLQLQLVRLPHAGNRFDRVQAVPPVVNWLDWTYNRFVKNSR